MILFRTFKRLFTTFVHSFYNQKLNIMICLLTVYLQIVNANLCYQITLKSLSLVEENDILFYGETARVDVVKCMSKKTQYTRFIGRNGKYRGASLSMFDRQHFQKL